MKENVKEGVIMGLGAISLRFFHPKRDLTFLSSMLDMPCFRCWAVGTPRQTPLGEPLPGINTESYWVSRLEYDVEDGFLKPLVSIIDLLAREKANFQDFRSTGGRIEIYLMLPGSVGNGGSIDASLLTSMGTLGIDLLVEVFVGM